MKKILLLIILILITGCENKAKAVITKSSVLKEPIPCMRLNNFNAENELTHHLKKIYHFNDKCTYSLTLKFKKDIVCNSTQNITTKSLGKMPKSFIELEVRKGFKTIYKYYIDLYHNANIDDLDEGFLVLKRDVITY
ncbi:hypothetical protein MNB_SV-9-235 [hydrothermal vent metagenome]|uniref:Lipoprotein n=1 Tax=hydrothermal vent metagenome TaxID=652676 RepID=A0A1W1BDC3_9ZZZZ